nr:unnamed protein product [Spirometra erinaceieuropaei]
MCGLPLSSRRTARQSEDQPTGTEEGASYSRTGALQDEHHCTQQDPLFRTRKLEEVGAGRPKARRRDSGVNFAIRNEILRLLPCLSQVINDRLVGLRLPPRGSQFATISAYAPSMTGPHKTKTNFYEDLHAFLASLPKTDILVVVDDFTARVGADCAA